jgi:ElaB/YqjD/DUF883 family membrane-anchored ribosome-binding protein
MMEHTIESSAALAEELRNVVNQAEALLDAIGQDRDQALEALRERVHESIDTARARLAGLEEQAERATRSAAATAELWVRENPWTAVAIGASVGLLIGALLTSRGRHSADEHESADA